VVSFLTTSLAARVRFPKSEIWRYVLSGFHQNLEPVDRDSESRRSISCGILLFPPTARWSSPCRVFHLVHRFWMVPPLWMVSHRYGPCSSWTFALGEVPRLYHNTPGQALTFHGAQTSSARIQDVEFNVSCSCWWGESILNSLSLSGGSGYSPGWVFATEERKLGLVTKGSPRMYTSPRTLSTVFSHYRRVGPDIACVPLRLCQPPSLRVVKTKLYCREELLQTSALRSLRSRLQHNFLRGLALKSPVAKRKKSEIKNNFSVKTREALLWSWPRVTLPCTFATRNSRMPFDED